MALLIKLGLNVTKDNTMITVETEYDANIVTVLDKTGENEDLQAILGFDGQCFIRQWNEEFNRFVVIQVSFDQIRDLMVGMTRSDGVYSVETKDE